MPLTPSSAHVPVPLRDVSIRGHGPKRKIRKNKCKGRIKFKYRAEDIRFEVVEKVRKTSDKTKFKIRVTN